MNKTATHIQLVKQDHETESDVVCSCGNPISMGRYSLGYLVCLSCGESNARQKKHTIVPMPKSNYMVVTDKQLLIGLNSSHKGSKT